MTGVGLAAGRWMRWGVGAGVLGALTYPVANYETKKRRALHAIADEKLCVCTELSREVHDPGSPYSRINVSFSAPYGLRSDEEPLSEWWVSDFDSNGDTKVFHSAAQPIIDFLEHSSPYFRCGDRFDALRFEKSCTQPLYHAEWSWMRKESETGDYGHINKKRPAIKKAKEELPPELAEKLPYLTQVTEIAMAALDSHIHSEYSCRDACMRNFYSSGLNPLGGRIADTGAIGVKMYYGVPLWLQTPLGNFRIEGPHSQSEEYRNLAERLKLTETVPETVYSSGDRDGPYFSVGRSLDGQVLPEMQAVHVPRSDINYYEEKGLWSQVRDVVFLEAMKRRPPVETASPTLLDRTKTSLHANWQSLANSAQVVYGSYVIRLFDALASASKE